MIGRWLAVAVFFHMAVVIPLAHPNLHQHDEHPSHCSHHHTPEEWQADDPHSCAICDFLSTNPLFPNLTQPILKNGDACIAVAVPDAMIGLKPCLRPGKPRAPPIFVQCG